MSIFPTNEEEFQELVKNKIIRNETWIPDTGNEAFAIKLSNDALQVLKTKTLSWLKLNQKKVAGLGTFWNKNCTWNEIVKHELEFEL